MRQLGRVFIGGCAVLWAVALISPAGALAGSISGNVTDESTDAGIGGIEVCLHPEPFAFEDPCTKTDADGNYALHDLPATSYHVHFNAWPQELNYVQEWYQESQVYPGDLVTLGESEARTGVDAELEKGGIVKGTATDATTSGPAAGVGVCVEAFEPVFYGSCRPTNSAGEYEMNDLPTGEYRISFDGENEVNYLRRYYDEEDQFGQATRLPVTAGSTVSGIDALLQPGGQILGTVTEAGTGVALDDVQVCLWRPSISLPPKYVERCDRTDASGNYAIRSLPGENYKVVFSQDRGGFDEDTFREQWWKGVASAAEATALTIAPPSTYTEINAQLVNFAVRDLPLDGGGTATPLPSPTPPAKKPPKKCKKGFHRKLVKGKKRCVRKHKKHQQRRKGGKTGKNRR